MHSKLYRSAHNLSIYLKNVLSSLEPVLQYGHMEIWSTREVMCYCANSSIPLLGPFSFC